MGIRDLLAAHDARFISISDLLQSVAEAEGVTRQDAARAFSIKGLLTKAPHRLCDYADGDYSECSGAAAYHELECAMLPTTEPSLSNAAISEFNRGEPGFFRDEIAAALKECGLIVPAGLMGQIHEAGEAIQEDVDKPATLLMSQSTLLPLVPRVNVSLSEAANLLSRANGWAPIVWRETLEDAADSGQIRSGTWSMDRGEQPLSHADIRAWCEAAGAVWPVPLPPSNKPTADDALREALAAERKARMAEYEAQRAELTAVKGERDKLRATVAELAAEVERLRSMADEAGKGAADLPRINSPTLQRIMEAVEHYPDWLKTQNQEPILKTVLAWQEGQQEKTGGNSRLAYVAHRVIAEHFDLKK